ncbi:hypothetical protein [Magnetovibrio blakemorei]|uniref:hypothetical protein n=1 Tax=Magnetovibrio blakemorei TaxID=28181 RepID=UPI001112E710|nr:hypothetical protein [Magnetovibrio blakemorei]
MKNLITVLILLSLSACTSMTEQGIIRDGGYRLDIDENLRIYLEEPLPLRKSVLIPNANGFISFIGNTTTNTIKLSVTDIFWRPDGTMHGISEGGRKTRQDSEGSWKVVNNEICVNWERPNWPDTCSRTFYDPGSKQLHQVLEDGSVWVSIFNFRSGNPENL